jgi:hypothetical protein
MLLAVVRDRNRIDADKLVGLKKLRQLVPMLEQLHDCGCARDRAGNRELHFDEYVTLVLLYLFNPLIDSMRGLQHASGLEKVAQALGVKRFSFGSFSESCRLFDPAMLRAVIEQLAPQASPVLHDPKLRDLRHLLTLVDGTVLQTIATVSEAFWRDYRDGTPDHAWRLHTHFELERLIPCDMELTDAVNSGDSDEKAVLRRKLKPDRCYVIDRGYAQFALFNDIHRAASSYVCRMKENSVYEVSQERELSDAARDAGVQRDVIVRMGLHSKPNARPDHPLRLVLISITPHVRRGGARGKFAGPQSQGTLVLATNLLDISGEVIALIYQYRWSIEVFFRFFKQILGCRHLLSTKPPGVLIQMYCAIIACLLINLWTGAKPTKRTVEMLAFYFMGLASEEEVLRHIAGLKKVSL